MQRHRIMRARTKMIDEKKKVTTNIAFVSVTDWASRVDGGGGGSESGSWHMPSVSMVVRTDENDEQCQIQEQNQDECGLRKDQWMLIYRKSVVASWVMVADVRLWLKEIVYWGKKREQILRLIVKPASTSLRAYAVPDCVVSAQVTI